MYEPVTKGRDLKWDTLPQNQTLSKLFSVLPLESGMFHTLPQNQTVSKLFSVLPLERGMFQVTISIIRK